jgi:hypothetical protein
MAVLACVRRSPKSLETHGTNLSVLLHANDTLETQAIVQTSRNHLIVYSIFVSTQDTDVLYKFDTSQAHTSQRRRSFASTGENEFIMPRSVKYKKMIKVESGISWYLPTPRRH